MKAVIIVVIFTMSVFCSNLDAALIHQAVYEKDYAKLESLLKEKPERAELWDQSGDMVKLLLEKGADPTVKDKNGFTPAERAKDKQIINLLEQSIIKKQDNMK